ncbi:MAG TPA: hypothetical protein VNX68_13835, partial [Nitrosopumilaceae archaeon]|nr:hypothetical protein [Nitrosopumilaceae archaeon]
MSEEKQNIPNKENNQNNQKERKVQFDKMKERFSKNSGGGNSPKNSFNFYWIYAIVVVALLVLTWYDGGGFGKNPIPATETEFEQNMLAKGDVGAIII